MLEMYSTYWCTVYYKGYNHGSQIRASVSCTAVSWDSWLSSHSCDVSTCGYLELKPEGSSHWGMFSLWQQCHCRIQKSVSRSQLSALPSSSSTLHLHYIYSAWNQMKRAFCKNQIENSHSNSHGMLKMKHFWGGGITDKCNPGWARD